MAERIVLEFDFESKKTKASWPTCLDADYPYFHIELELESGTAAGGPWITFKIVDCIDTRMVGKSICCEEDTRDGYTFRYEAKQQWDDGFVSNCAYDAKVPYHEGEDDEEGTPMGGEVIPRLDGMTFSVSEEKYNHMIDEV